jgi:hypothetical protein
MNTDGEKSKTACALNLNTHSNNSKACMTPYEFVALIISALTLGLVGITATVYYCQLREMQSATKATQIAAEAAEKAAKISEGQLEQMKSGSEQTDKIIKEAHRMSDAMEETLRQSRVALDASIEASRLDQRAWVGIKNMSISTMEVGQRLRTGIDVINSGKTIAKDLRQTGYLVISRKIINIDEVVTSGTLPSTEPHIFGSTFPNQQVVVNNSIDSVLTAEQINAIKSGTLFVYLFGDLFYLDVYNRSHVTQYAGRYDPNSGIFLACPEHRNAD